MVTKASWRSWLLAQAFPKTGETPSLGDGDGPRPSGASYLYSPRATLPLFSPPPLLPPISISVQAVWLARMVMARGALSR